jgi:N-acetylglucosamine-6-phosphate deacetylase
MTAVIASEGLCPPGVPAPGWIAIDGGDIVDVGAGTAPTGAADVGDALLAPAFVDVQCNGVGEIDLAAADATGWQMVATELAHHGVGSFLATFVTAPLDRYPAMLDEAAAAQTSGDGRAALVGVHLEGPFLGGALGAHDPALVHAVDAAWLQATLERHPGLVRMVTLAPEADPGLLAIRLLASAGVVVALGHTSATYEDALAAADAGASVVTHLFNGMTPFHHRAPGLVGAALDDDRLTPTVIADLAHVHPAALRLAFAREPRIAVVSDAVAVVDGLDARDGAAWLADGTMAGATTLLDGALRNLVASGISIERAVGAVAAAPARLAGLGDRGELRIGARADVVALDPATLAVRRVWIGGAEIARRPWT